MFAEQNQNVPSRGRWEQMGNFLRPPMIQPFECRNAKNLAFHDVRINTQKGPALLCEKVAGLELDGVQTLAPHPDSAVIDLKDVAGAYIHSCRTTPGSFLHVRGRRSRDILLQANEFGEAPSAIKIDEEVPASALIQR